MPKEIKPAVQISEEEAKKILAEAEKIKQEKFAKKINDL
jgi:division protein CdvB (Snf7/Vps24/ESCRT-III family)